MHSDCVPFNSARAANLAKRAVEEHYAVVGAPPPPPPAPGGRAGGPEHDPGGDGGLHAKVLPWSHGNLLAVQQRCQQVVPHHASARLVSQESFKASGECGDDGGRGEEPDQRGGLLPVVPTEAPHHVPHAGQGHRAPLGFIALPTPRPLLPMSSSSPPPP